MPFTASFCFVFKPVIIVMQLEYQCCVHPVDNEKFGIVFIDTSHPLVRNYYITRYDEVLILNIVYFQLIFCDMS